MTLAETIASSKKAWKLEELAELLNCSKGKLYKMVNTGRIPYIRVGTMLRFDPVAVANWLEGKTLSPATVPASKTRQRRT